MQLKDQELLENFATKDFDVAIKSRIPLKFFRRYIYNQSEHYEETIINKLNEGQPMNRMVCAHKNSKIGEIYLELFELITIYRVRDKAVKGN